MSTIYTDGAGNKYLGDCVWAAHDISYPAVSYLESGVNHTSLSADIASLFSAAGYQYRNVLAQSTINALTSTNYSLVHWATGSDSIDDRYSINYAFGGGVGATSNHPPCYLYNDSGGTSTSNTPSATNSVLYTHTRSSGINDYSALRVNGLGLSASQKLPSLVAVAGQKSLAMLWAQYTTTATFYGKGFFYTGEVLDVNTNFSYYSGSRLNYTVMFSSTFDASFGVVMGGHYIASNKKVLLTTGDAAYSIACSDSQTPTAQWATDFYVFDNNATLGYPPIGRVANMLLGIGSYTYLKPVKIIGSVFPDAGSPWYIPVGTFAGKTLLMRCYSSMT